MHRKMKDSGVEWIGQIPEEWEISRLKLITDVNVESLEEKTPLDYEFEYVDIGSVSLEHGIIQKQKMIFGKAPSRARRIVRHGDIIISTVRTYLKSIARIEQDKLIVSTGFAVLSARNVNNIFLEYVCKNESFINFIMANSVGISYPAINTTKLMCAKVVIPTNNEQHRIASYLDEKVAHIDNIIDKTKQTIEDYKKYKQSLITEAVTKGLDPDVKMKDSGVEWIGQIPEHWTIRKLGAIADIQTGPFGSQLHNEDYVSNGTPIITVEHFGEMNITHDNLPCVSDDDYLRLKKYVLRTGDLVFSRVGSVDRSVIVSGAENGWLFSGRCLRVRLFNELVPQYINYCFYMSSFKQHMNISAVGSTMLSINTSILSRIRIAIPSISEQYQMIKYLDYKCYMIDNLLEQKRLLLSELESYKKSLIYEVVTGKREVS